MAIVLTQQLKNRLIDFGVEVLLAPGAIIGDQCEFEPPCSIKWMQIEYGLSLGAFSYGVDGFYSGVRIGRYCSIAGQVQIGRSDHPTNWLSTNPFQYLHTPLFNVGNRFKGAKEYHAYTPPTLPAGVAPTVSKLITIGNDVWIGQGALLRPGITIGDGAIIGACAVVTKNVAPYTVVAGNPARVIKQRFPDNIVNDLMELQWWRFAPWQLKDVPFHDIKSAIAALHDKIPALTPYKPDIFTLNATSNKPAVVASEKSIVSNNAAITPLTAPLTSNLSVEDHVINLWSAAIAASVKPDFNQGPAIPFIQIGRFLNLAEKINLSMEGKCCMDYGCGQVRSFSIAAVLYLLGADSIVSTDIAPYHDPSAVAKGLWCLLAVLALDDAALTIPAAFHAKINKTRILDFDLDALKQGHLLEGLPKAFHYFTGNYPELEQQIGAVDIIISNSVFEHDLNLEQTLKLFKKHLRPHGCVYSDIDYRDHRMYTDNLSPWQYLIDDGDVSPNYINKIRASEMLKVIASAGFRVAASDKVVVAPPPETLDQLHSRYKNLSHSDLTILQDSLIFVAS